MLTEVIDIVESEAFVGTRRQCEAFSRWFTSEGDGNKKKKRRDLDPQLGYYEFLHHHHEIEEEIFFPAVRDRVAARSYPPFPIELEDDHVELTELMNELKTLAISQTKKLEKVQPGVCLTGDEIDTLRDCLITFRYKLFYHLEAEERYMSAALWVLFTEAEVLPTLIPRLGHQHPLTPLPSCPSPLTLTPSPLTLHLSPPHPFLTTTLLALYTGSGVGSEDRNVAAHETAWTNLGHDLLRHGAMVNRLSPSFLAA